MWSAQEGRAGEIGLFRRPPAPPVHYDYLHLLYYLDEWNGTLGKLLSQDNAPGGTLAPFWEGRNYLESSHPHQHPGHILALDIEVEDTNVVYQDSKRPVSEVGSGLP